MLCYGVQHPVDGWCSELTMPVCLCGRAGCVVAWFVTTFRCSVARNGSYGPAPCQGLFDLRRMAFSVAYAGAAMDCCMIPVRQPLPTC